MNQLAIIGAGQLGTRHLQALALLKEKTIVWVIDTSAAALELADKRWQEVGSPSHIRIKFINSITNLPAELSVAVIATNAGARKIVIETLLKQCKVTYLVIEKFLFNSLADFDAVQDLLNKNKVKAWVNCPRRMYPGYQRLKNSLQFPVEIYVSGTNWGLACNSIHWLDLLHYLNPAKQYVVTGELGPIIESKRPGYIEFNGYLLIGDEHNNSLRLSCEEGVSVSSCVEVKETNGGLTRVDEARQVINTATGSQDIFSVWKQSEMTNKVVEQLITTGDCQLTPYSESSDLHKVLFSFLLQHYNQLNNTSDNKLCPIT